MGAEPPVSIISSGPTYDRNHIWYNFTVTGVFKENLTWGVLQFWVIPGPLTKASTNWTLVALTSPLGDRVPFQVSSGIWTTNSSLPVVAGETIQLVTDSSLTLGSFDMTWPTVGPGSYGIGLT